MIETNAVTMSIPYSNPLFDWVLRQCINDPVSYVTLSVDGIEARLALVEVPGIHYTYETEIHLTTEWRLLRSEPSKK